ncbi:hypothetical protein GCM10011344_21740 [Dokdonia pacifica]|uniref:Uncharacterized protein n=1 Tax=Dokdonia pacifica TaxID=1627892 RepID=A0A238WEZ6_9FLAO|nr:hypothetical protein [Dokdonia pacifica]GGG20700.1 hypothetical protein GCM10011344_21740 [Dokdonia pacifica]SNR45018.1 hypothetical protein SAMN06265376_1011003 [Dokdonia pacifica]
MRTLIYTLCFLVLPFTIFSQEDTSVTEENAPEIYFMKGDGGHHYINNEIFYTMKFPGEDVQYMDNGAFKTNDYIINIINAPYDTDAYHNGKSIEEEKAVLTTFKASEVNNMREALQMEIPSSEEFFTNEEGKLFYLFNYGIPESKVNLEEDYLSKIYILCFIVNDTMATISFPLFSSENEEDKLAYIKTVSETVDIFPATISMNFLRQRIMHTSEDPISINYEGANFKFIVPDYLNVIDSQSETQWYASFPDVNNVKNAVVINITNKSNYKSFKAFNDEVMPRGKIGESDGNYTLLLKEELSNIGAFNGESYRMQYMLKSMQMYHSKKVSFQTKNYYGIILFNATTETYAKNIDRFDAFLEGFEIIE